MVDSSLLLIAVLLVSASAKDRIVSNVFPIPLKALYHGLRCKLGQLQRLLWYILLLMRNLHPQIRAVEKRKSLRLEIWSLNCYDSWRRRRGMKRNSPPMKAMLNAKEAEQQCYPRRRLLLSSCCLFICFILFLSFFLSFFLCVSMLVGSNHGNDRSGQIRKNG